MEILWLADIEELAGVKVFRYLVLMQRVSQSRGSCVNNKWAGTCWQLGKDWIISIKYIYRGQTL